MTPTERARIYPRLAMVGECWVWQGAKNSGGYGTARRSGAGPTAFVHRLVYEDQVGPIPAGLTLDHLCRNRACALPAHLEPTSMRANTLRGLGPTAVNAARTECQRGHPFTPENTRPREGGWRLCRTCHRVMTARRRAGRRAS